MSEFNGTSDIFFLISFIPLNELYPVCTAYQNKKIILFSENAIIHFDQNMVLFLWTLPSENKASDI